ncbi:pentapeptide repeat-containing protein [Advenella kashmirensis]|uniref:pentapeptide repeat-containing protein n=1 Tax=Advenella kashmirensis TaxID=310575 RepID=UPI0009DA7CD1
MRAVRRTNERPICRRDRIYPGDADQRVLSGAQLNKTVWSDAILTNTDFSRSNLEYSIFERSRCEGTVFTSCNLAYANFDYAIIENANFQDANRTHIRAHGATGRATGFPGNTDDVALRRAELHSVRHKNPYF